MKKRILFTFCFQLLIFNFSIAQNAIEILQRSLEKTSSINTCSYLVYHKSKVTGMRDTIYQTGKCSFKHFDKDTLLGYHIRVENFLGITEFYNGSEYFKSRITDSTVYIWDAKRFTFFKRQLSLNPIIYSVFLNTNNIYRQLANDDETTFALLNDTLIDRNICNHIKSFSQKKNTAKDASITIEADLFIRKSDYIPLGHIQQLHSGFNKALNNYDSVFIEELEINKVIDDSVFSLNSVPPSYTLKQKTIIGIKNYIVASEQISDLKYETLTGNNPSFKNNLDKTLLIGFIEADYCLPCLKAMEMMEELYQEFKKKEVCVLIIATHPLDTKPRLEFLMTEDETNPSLYDGQKIIEQNNITAFPTFYLLKGNKQVYKSEGYNERLKQDIESEIKVTFKK